VKSIAVFHCLLMQSVDTLQCQHTVMLTKYW